MAIAIPNTLFICVPKYWGTSLEVALGIAAAYPEFGLERIPTRPDFRKLFGGGLQHLSGREVLSNYSYTLAPDVPTLIRCYQGLCESFRFSFRIEELQICANLFDRIFFHSAVIYIIAEFSRWIKSF